jgi:hypothetical protein
MQVSLPYMVLGYFMCNVSPVLLFIVFLDFLGYKYFVVYPDRELLSRLEKGLSKMSLIKSSSVQNLNGRDFHNSIFLSLACPAFVDNRRDEATTVYMLTTSKIYADLMKEETIVYAAEPVLPSKEKTQYVTVYKRRGMYKNFYYLPSRLDLGHIVPIGDQPFVVESIISQYLTRGRATIFLHGSPGTGKSTVGYLLAKELRGRYCHTFNPSDPGDTIHELFNSCEVDSSTPLIVVLEEVDTIFEAITSKKLLMSPDIPTQVYSKATWTAFLDDMVFMKHVVLILTSNTSKAELDKRDPAMLRAGRVHASFCMTQALHSE